MGKTAKKANPGPHKKQGHQTRRAYKHRRTHKTGGMLNKMWRIFRRKTPMKGRVYIDKGNENDEFANIHPNISSTNNSNKIGLSNVSSTNNSNKFGLSIVHDEPVPNVSYVEKEKIKIYFKKWVVDNIDKIMWSRVISIQHPYVLKVIEIIQNFISKYINITGIQSDILETIFVLKVRRANKIYENVYINNDFFSEKEKKTSDNIIEELIKELKQMDYTRVKPLADLMMQDLKNKFQEERLQLNYLTYFEEKNKDYIKKTEKENDNLEKNKEELIIYDIYDETLTNSDYWSALASDTSNHSNKVINVLIPKLIEKEAKETDADTIESENDSKRLIIDGLLKNRNPNMFSLFAEIYKKEKYYDFFKDQIINLKLDLGLELDSDELKRKLDPESGFIFHDGYNYSAEVFGNPNIFNEKGELKNFIQKWFVNINTKKTIKPNLYNIMVDYLSSNPNQHIHDFLIKNNIEIQWERMSANEVIFKMSQCEAFLNDYILTEYQYESPYTLNKINNLIDDIESKRIFNEENTNIELFKTILSNKYGIYFLEKNAPVDETYFQKNTKTKRKKDILSINELIKSIKTFLHNVEKQDDEQPTNFMKKTLKEFGFSFLHPESFWVHKKEIENDTEEIKKDKKEIKKDKKEIESMKDKIKSNIVTLEDFNEKYGCFFEVTPGYTSKEQRKINETQKSQKRLMKPTM